MFDKFFLEYIQFSVFFQTLYCKDPRPIHLSGKYETGRDRPAIHDYSTSSAFSLRTAFFGPCKSQVITQKIYESFTSVSFTDYGFSVHFQL